jgi:hypothetical protein
MFTITINLDLSKEAEQKLEKDFAYLEKITKKPKEYHIKEALIRYMEDAEEIKEIEKLIKRKKLPSEYHIIAALLNYKDDMREIRAIEKHIKQAKEGKAKYYTSEEVSERLGLND